MVSLSLLCNCEFLKEWENGKTDSKFHMQRSVSKDNRYCQRNKRDLKMSQTYSLLEGIIKYYFISSSYYLFYFIFIASLQYSSLVPLKKEENKAQIKQLLQDHIYNTRCGQDFNHVCLVTKSLLLLVSSDSSFKQLLG